MRNQQPSDHLTKEQCSSDNDIKACDADKSSVNAFPPMEDEATYSDKLSSIAAGQKEIVRVLNGSISEKEQTIRQLQEWLRASDREKDSLEKRLKEQENQIQHLQNENVHLRHAYQFKEEEYNIISNAAFWKITKPLRKMVDVIKLMFRDSKYARLFWKGLKCLKENGIRYTIWKVRQKAKHLSEEDAGDLCSLSEAQNVKTVEKYTPNAEIYNETVDLILPVYNGWRILPPLLSSVFRTHMKCRLFIVDDKSPDERILPMLRKFAAEHENVILIENEKNLGYTGSVNKALAMTKGHVVLLNSDIRLPELWLERLMEPIILRENVASATPFTNSGEICSFPDFCKNNKLFLSLSVDEIDEAFSRISPIYTEVPTGVGFCMALNRKAIEEVGLYDEKHFAVGYGEENDWCQRAISKGYRNVIVENLFVYHQHGATFTPERKKKLIEHNHQELLKKHKNYDKDVSVFCRKDPLRGIREAVKIALLNSAPADETIIAFDHAWGGGASSYLESRKEELLDSHGKMIIIRYRESDGKYTVAYFYKNFCSEFSAKRIENILNILPKNSNEIWFNELVSYPSLFDTQRIICNYAKKTGTRLVFRLHDYYCICPHITLLDSKEKYCGVKSAKECEDCACTDTDMEQWRDEWGTFLLQCDEITAFSEDSVMQLTRAYPEVMNKIKLVPHKVEPLDKVQVESDRRYLTIGLLGGLGVAKGLHIVQKMCRMIDRKHLRIRVKLIGYAGEPMNEYRCFSQTGAYTPEDLPELIEENQIDLILIPSIWPETFSYTTSEAMSMGLPVACFNLGAPAERVSVYEKGLIIDDINARTALQQIMEFMDFHTSVTL